MGFAEYEVACALRRAAGTVVTFNDHRYTTYVDEELGEIGESIIYDLTEKRELCRGMLSYKDVLQLLWLFEKQADARSQQEE